MLLMNLGKHQTKKSIEKWAKHFDFNSLWKALLLLADLQMEVFGTLILLLDWMCHHFL